MSKSVTSQSAVKTMHPESVIIVGAGLAGMSCAFELADRGIQVTVLEARETLGGRTASWIDDGMPVESGLHKFLGIYRALPDLLRRVGVDLDDMLAWVDDLEFQIPSGPDGRFTFSPYHAPAKTGWSLLTNNHFLPPWDKAKLVAMGAAGLAKCAAKPEELDQISIAAYAAEFGVSAQTIQRVLSTATQAALFLSADRFSAYAAFAPLLEGVKHGMTMRIGAFKGGMSEVMAAPIAHAIEQRGGTIKQGAKVSKLIVRDGRVAGVQLGDQKLMADQVVVAVPLRPAQDLLRESFGDDHWLEPMLKLPSLSAATVQFELDAPSLDSDRTNFSPTSLCCFAEQSRTTFTHVAGRLSAILYPPEDFIDMPPEDILEQAYVDADSLGIQLRGHVNRYRVVHHRHDFYAMHPGTEALRPTQETPVKGLALAGDYTKQPFSASMEGAVLSGRQAATAVVNTS